MATKKAKVKLNLRNLSVEEKIVFSKQVITSMTGNVNFATPVPALASITAAITAAETANADLKVSRKATVTKASILDDKLAELDSVVAQLANYVENVAKGDDTKIKSAGMGVRSQASPIGLPSSPENLLTAAVTQNEVELDWEKVTGAKSYVVQLTLDISGNSNWTMGTIVTKAKATIKNLESGKKYWFRVAAVGAAGQGPWSDPATTYAT
jgi:hypothetical protein